MRSKEDLPLKLRYAPNALLFIVCFIICIVLFHDLLAQSRVLWCLVTAAVTGGVFGLVYWIRIKYQQSIDEANQRMEQVKKEAEADRQRRLAESREKEYAAKKEEKLKQERIRQQVEELLARPGNEYYLETDIFLTEIAEETSMLKIWNIWQKHQLAEVSPKADEFILKYKEAERMYGRLSNIDSLKKELRMLLL